MKCLISVSFCFSFMPLFPHRCPWLSEQFSVAVPIYNGIMFLFVLANFCMATFMDPGIFPRGSETICDMMCLCVRVYSCSRMCGCLIGKTNHFIYKPLHIFSPLLYLVYTSNCISVDEYKLIFWFNWLWCTKHQLNQP